MPPAFATPKLPPGAPTAASRLEACIPRDDVRSLVL